MYLGEDAIGKDRLADIDRLMLKSRKVISSKECLMNIAQDWERLTEMCLPVYLSDAERERMYTTVLSIAANVSCLPDRFIQEHPGIHNWVFLCAAVQWLCVLQEPAEFPSDWEQEYNSEWCFGLALDVGAWARGYCAGKGWLLEYKNNEFDRI